MVVNNAISWQKVEHNLLVGIDLHELSSIFVISVNHKQTLFYKQIEGELRIAGHVYVIKHQEKRKAESIYSCHGLPHADTGVSVMSGERHP